jgi:hypothetical protein
MKGINIPFAHLHTPNVAIFQRYRYCLIGISALQQGNSAKRPGLSAFSSAYSSALPKVADNGPVKTQTASLLSF